MDSIIIEESQSKAIGRVLLGIGMTVLGVLIGVFGVKMGRVLYTLIGVVSGIFFGVCTAYLFSRIMKPKALLTIRYDGIEDTSSASAVGFISFGDIMRFQVINLYGQEMIGLDLKNTESFISKLPAMQQRAAKANLRLNCPAISLRLDTAKDMKIDDIYSLLKKRLDDYNSLYN